MKPIDPRTWRPLFDAVFEMNKANDHADFVSAVTAGMNRLISADYCHIHVVDRTRNRIAHQTFPSEPYLPDEVAYYAAHPQANPLVAYYQRTGVKNARRLSDVISLAEHRRTEFFDRCHRRLGIRYCLALPVTVDRHTIAALAFDRRRTDFTSRHCALLDAFAPHFRLAWRRYSDPWTEHRSSKPTARERLRQLGLTAREADVLFWIAEGKQNREIATILGRRLDTVQEHVANIVRKLGQENRHATTVFVLRELQR